MRGHHVQRPHPLPCGSRAVILWSPKVTKYSLHEPRERHRLRVELWSTEPYTTASESARAFVAAYGISSSSASLTDLSKVWIFLTKAVNSSIMAALFTRDCA